MTKPLSNADALFLAELLPELRGWLSNALATAEGYRSQVPQLATAIADALTSTDQAISVLNDLEADADGRTISSQN